jgi:hypothetical protein
VANLFKILSIYLVGVLLSGCAYVEYRRVYDIEPRLSIEQRVAVSASIERYFVAVGYVLKQRFRDYHPADMYVSVLEIPREREQKVREPRLFILVKQDGSVQLMHSEWFLNDNPFGESKYKPQDVVSLVREDLIAKVRREVGVSVDVQLSERGYY